MHLKHRLLATAVASTLATSFTPFLASTALAETNAADDKTIQAVTVTASPFGSNSNDQILTPAKVLSGDELRDKVGDSLGDTLSHELGVSASAFGAGASRPIIRGMEGARVKVLQNGMSVSDVSGLSNDHAVATEGSTARQIEILRGPAALLYGSGAIGGLVNVVNDRIPTQLADKPTGEAELRYGSVDQSKNGSLSVDGATGSVGLHLDANARDAGDYKIPGQRVLDDASQGSGTLRHSYTREHSIGVGASYIRDWGHVGASVGSMSNRYGIPTLEGSQIDQRQTRYDIDALVKEPVAGFETFKFKLGYTDYKHTELDLEDVPQTHFTNKSLETRWELTHQTVAGWHGSFGMQSENTKFSALSAEGGPDTVPATNSRSLAAFLVEERSFGAVKMNAGVRFENVKREPVSAVDRSFNLTSYSVGGLWNFMPGYGFGVTGSVAQRAPAPEELYSGGPHDATATFDIGNPNLQKETSHNLELTLQKTEGLVRWKANLFENHVKNFVYGQIPGNKVDADGNPGDEFSQRIFTQADATIHGGEAEVSYNQHGDGLSLRGFADTSRGRLDDAGSLPLQPATRFGVDAGHRQGPWRSGVSVLRAQRQDRLAAFETTATPGYTQVNANLSYTQHVGDAELTWFALAKNLLNQDIRMSTSVLKDVSPLPGRSLVVGVRTRF